MVTKKERASQRLEQLERPRHREKSKVSPMIRLGFFKAALDKILRTGLGRQDSGQVLGPITSPATTSPWSVKPQDAV